MAEELDMTNRDPNNLNSHLGQVSFEEVLGEPDGVHSLDFVWKCSYKCFTFWKNTCYMLATLLCGCCTACYWGCVFAYIAFENVWCITPNLKVCEVYLGIWKKLLTIFFGCFLDPLCTSVGNVFHAFAK